MPTVNGVTYQVFHAESVLDPVEAVVDLDRAGKIRPPTEFEPMPYAPGWVVKRADGQPVTQADGVAARQLFAESCPDSKAIGRLLSNGGDPVWFFGECPA